MEKPLKKIFEKSKERINTLKSLMQKLHNYEALESESNDLELVDKSPSKEITVNVSWQSVAKSTIAVLVLLALANFVSQISTILLILFISILFAAALDPIVDKLEARKVPRAVSVIGLFCVLFFILGFFISQLIPLVAEQLIEMARNLSAFVQNLDTKNLPKWLPQIFTQWAEANLDQLDKQQVLNNALQYLESLEAQIKSFAGNTLTLIKDIFNGIFNFFLVLILTFFLVVDEKGVESFFVSLFPSKHGKYVFKKLDAIKDQVGQWLRGQIILMCLMFGLSLIAFLILGLESAVTLAMMAGIAELIPVAGPLLAGLPALMLALNDSGWLALWTLVAIIIMQQIEGNLLVPMVMKKALGLSPIIIIVTMLIGYEMLGVLGVIIAMPVTTTISIFVKDYTSKQK